MSEELTRPVSLPGRSANITFWKDDTIETIRMRIGQMVGMHPDRLRIFVQAELPADVYTKDSRKWESVFLRMSPEGKPVGKLSLDILSSYTEPGWVFEATEYDKATWMTLPRERGDTFTELRILGAPEERSWILPLDGTTEPPFVPPAAQNTIEPRALFQSVHPYEIGGFRVIPYEDGLRPQLESLYFPFLRSGSPAVVPGEILRSIARQDELLSALVSRESPSPSHQTVVRARWKIPLVDTDFGTAVRNRFEQIFYGATVSKTIPAISFFGSRQEQSRHKFFTLSASDKVSLVPLRTWQYWWNASKPTRNKPAILFYRGNARFDYDRITVTSTEIVVSAHRPEESEESLEKIRDSLKEWIASIDGLTPFLEQSDLDETRWDLQDVAASIRYARELKEGDFRRFDCLRGMFEIVSHDKLMFKLLRADQTDIGLSPVELRVIQFLRDNEFVTPAEIAEGMDISEEEASEALGSVREKLEDNPDLLDRQFSNLPTFRFSAKGAVVTYAIDLPRVLKYISILRAILMNPEDATDLDDVCPARGEAVEAVAAELPPTVEVAAEEGGLDFLDDLLGEIAEANIVAAPAVAEEAPKAKPAKKIAAKGTTTTLEKYLLTQLREFDPDTYDPDDPQVLRKCDKPRQPIAISQERLDMLKDGEYDPRKGGPSKLMEVKDPDGAILCPEYWCTIDQIPLTKEQIDDAGGICPVCSGKIRSNEKSVEKTQDIVEFPVIQRDSSIVFPGVVKYKSKKNGRPIPCCFTTDQTTKLGATKPEIPTVAEAFYVLGESKSKLGSLRLGYIPKHVGKALGIPINYKDTIAAANRIQAGQSGFYRAGVGHAAETLPTIVGFAGSVKPPIQNVDVTMRCSFFRSWRGADEDADESIIPKTFVYREHLAARVASIDKAFKEKRLSPLEELEYVAIALDCQLFLLYVTSDEVQIGCFMNIGAVRSVNRAVIAMVGESGYPDYITHVARITTTPQFTGNLYKATVFPDGILKKLTDLRRKACVSDIPTIDNTIAFVNSLKSLKTRMPEMKVVMDPYGRAQALFIPELVLIPFKPTSQIPTFLEERVTGYAEIPYEELPYKGDELEFLEEAVRFHPGFEYAHDVGNAEGRVTELILRSGLRIPVQTDDEYTEDTTEIVETVRDVGEGALVWGEPDRKMERAARAITYEAEVFDFLLYQLSYDIQHGEEYRALRTILSQNHPAVRDLEPLLHEWVDNTLTFTEADNPPAFVKKMRSPCSTGSCDGSLCYMDGASCRVEVKQVRPSLSRARLERRLLTTLISNEKIRDIIWKHKTSPFFSSVLYLEAPYELILSDVDVAKRLRA